MLARANKPCSVCLGSKLDRADAMRGGLHVIRAAAPIVFRYCCARGMQNPPAAPAKKLQRFETLRLLWRRDSVCRNDATDADMITHCSAEPRSTSNLDDLRCGKVGDFEAKKHCRDGFNFTQTLEPL